MIVYNTIEELNMRGVEALTQSEKRIEHMLLDNINSIGGKKAIGFKNTRIHILTNEFDNEALDELVEVSIEIYNEIGSDKSNDFIKMVVKNLMERVFRDHVPTDMVTELRCGIAQRVKLDDGNARKAIDGIKRYLTCGYIVPIAETYRHACKELEEGRVIYIEPRKTTI